MGAGPVAARGITADTALRLAGLLNTSPQFWMRLRADWDLHQAVTRAAHRWLDACPKQGLPPPGAHAAQIPTAHRPIQPLPGIPRLIYSCAW